MNTCDSAAFSLLESVIREETLDFEKRTQGRPFLPSAPPESVKIFDKHCRRINSFFGDNTLQHLCFMGIRDPANNFIFVLQWRDGKAEHDPHQVKEEILRPKIVPLIDFDYFFQPESISTPMRIEGLKAVSYYLVLSEHAQSATLIDTANSKESAGGPVLVSGVVCPPKGKSSLLTDAIDSRTSQGTVHFEAYHVISGIHPTVHARLPWDVAAQKALELASMQFQREWGSGELAEKKLAEARLFTFDQILHSGLNALRSIQSGVACTSLASGSPPLKLRYRLVKSTRAGVAGKPDELAEEILLKSLNRMWRAERATAAALSLGRLLAHRKLLKAMRASEPYCLKNVVDNAIAMLFDFDQGRKRPSIQWEGPDIDRPRILAGYLQPDLLIGLVYELLLNAYNHATQPITIRLVSEFDTSAREVCVDVISLAADNTEWEQVGTITVPRGAGGYPRRESFLIRFAKVEEMLGRGLGIKSFVVPEGPDKWYHAQLWMRSLELESGEKAFPL
jgi:hypothetical protein